MTEVTDALKPCPFCGGPAAAQQYRSRNWGAGCISNDCQHMLTAEAYGTSRARAISAWNTRAASPADAAPDEEQATGANGQSVVLLTIGGRTVEVDVEIAPIVRALNDAGVATIASCSGHGHRPANIVLKDGREIIIARNHAEGRLIDSLFPLDINGLASTPTLREPDDAVTICGNGPNDPAAMICSKLAHLGHFVKIEEMREILSMLAASPRPPLQPATGFINAIADRFQEAHIPRLSRDRALLLALTAMADAETDLGPINHPDFDWSLDGARVIADENIEHWEAPDAA